MFRVLGPFSTPLATLIIFSSLIISLSVGELKLLLTAGNMGSVSLKIDDGSARFRRSPLCSSALHLLMLFSVLTTNLFAFYAFTSSSNPSKASPLARRNSNISAAISDHISLILREIQASERRLRQIQRDLAGYDTLDVTRSSLPPELKLFLSRHPLPLGRDARSGMTAMTSSVAHLCARSTDALSSFMDYKPFADCPPHSAATVSARKLISKGCEPSPRRRCLTRSPAKTKSLLLPYPQSLWSAAAGFTGRGGYSGFDPSLFVKPRGKTDFTVDEILKLAKLPIRTGLDISGGGGNFAARMAERNVTIITTALDCGEVVSARGLFPLQLSPAQRFPFYDSVFDIIHAMRGLDEGAAGSAQLIEGTDALEFLFFDIDRVLRTGGLFWIDNYHCVDDEKTKILIKLIERFGYKKLKSVTGERSDTSAGSAKSKIYLSTVLQKPPRG